ncbi:ankyrin repeat domain-containing protein [Acinetobacter pollinis]|uniref:Ankyrin repeat domain-containing protein n=1 Tax=Acinetobacter pollinis TaxID=2605270 RepID=A0ABU6DUN1_9GAMM|nr:ankyrin repeat domain-containing protein [Acinetobacter pollinis]MEB5477564.1 ankyrin repeat domain-containing protein [Acinetobacter pollinis]
MASFPKIESVILEIYQSLGSDKSYASNKKTKLSNGEMRLAEYTKMMEDMTFSILEKLKIPLGSIVSINDQLSNIASAYFALSLKTWTFSANQKQIDWMLLTHFLMPGLARFSAFQAIDTPFDKGMPGGRFWYLPEVNEKNILSLPVAHVMDWVADLLGDDVEQIFEKVAIDVDHARRSFYNWRTGENAIRHVTIQEYFSDDLILDFKGAFILPDNLNLDEQFNQALSFIDRKKLDASLLKLEIPLSEERIQNVLSAKVNEDEKVRFIECLLERYSKPSMETIRNRLLIASTIQDMYQRLLKHLTPDVDKYCPDPKQNKILQLFAIYRVVYNATIDAYSNCKEDSEVAEDQLFESYFSDWDRQSLFLSIMPSYGDTSLNNLSALLTYYFRNINSDKLEDVIGLDPKSYFEISEKNKERLKVFYQEVTEIEEISSKLQRGSPWRTLQSVSNYWVMSGAAQLEYIPIHVKELIANRMKELACTPIEKTLVVMPELHHYLNGDHKNKTKGCEAKVQALIEEAEKSEGYELFQHIILQYKAKHLLAQNQFDEATKCFRDALEKSFERSPSIMSGEIGRDCFAITVSNQKLISNNHEKYYRAMINGGMIEENRIPSIEELARWVSNYFWSDLYKPYKGLEVQKRIAQTKFDPAFDAIVKFLKLNDFNGFSTWLDKNPSFFKTSIPDVDGNSMLMLLVKFLPQLQYLLDSQSFNTFIVFLNEILKKYPNQINMRDLKGQTPLMILLGMQQTDLIKKIIEAGADLNIQNFQGMSALHTICKIRDEELFDIIFNLKPNWDIETADGQLAIHTACWAGNLYAVKKLIGLRPEQLSKRNGSGFTPLELVEDLIDHPNKLSALITESHRNGYSCATKQELQTIHAFLDHTLNSNPI